MSVSDETGWEFETVKRVYANVGLSAEGRQTSVAWEIVRLSPRSTALEPEEVRRETLVFPIPRWEARVFTVQARMVYRFAPGGAGFGREGASVRMAESAISLPGERSP